MLNKAVLISKRAESDINIEISKFIGVVAYDADAAGDILYQLSSVTIVSGLLQRSNINDANFLGIIMQSTGMLLFQIYNPSSIGNTLRVVNHTNGKEVTLSSVSEGSWVRHGGDLFSGVPEGTTCVFTVYM